MKRGVFLFVTSTLQYQKSLDYGIQCIVHYITERGTERIFGNVTLINEGQAVNVCIVWNEQVRKKVEG